MELDDRIRGLGSRVRYRKDLVASGMSDREIAAAVRCGDLVRILRGAFVNRDSWWNLSAEEQLVARAAAKSHELRSGPPVFSHTTAAALWGLPLYRYRLGRLDLIRDPESPSHSSGPVTRHVLDLSEAEVVTLGGLKCTSLERTIIDISMSASGELAIGCADAALRRSMRARARGSESVEEWRSERFEELKRIRGRQGVRRARSIIGAADPRAESVLESVSRLHLRRLGVQCEIQVPVVSYTGANYWVDFEFLGEGALGEVDGAIKYSDTRLDDGRTPLSRLIAEKEREDEIRGTTGKRIVRWGSRHLSDQYALGDRLLAFGIRVPAMQ